MTIIGRKRGSNLPVLSEPRQSPLAAPLADELAFALKFARAEKSRSTRRAYRSDFYAFRKWCGARNLNALPAAPATLATFLASEASRFKYAATFLRESHGSFSATYLNRWSDFAAEPAVGFNSPTNTDQSISENTTSPSMRLLLRGALFRVRTTV